MTPRLKQKLDRLVERHEELSALLSDASVISNQTRFRDYSREYAELEPVVACHRQWHQAQQDIESATLMSSDSDADMRAMAEEELADARVRAEQYEQELQRLMLPRDPRDRANVFLEIRAGTGGDTGQVTIKQVVDTDGQFYAVAEFVSQTDVTDKVTAVVHDI